MQLQTTRLSFSQAWQGFLLAKAAEGRSPHTLADYRNCGAKLATWLASQGDADSLIGDLTTEDLRHFFVSLRQGRLSPKTVKNVHTALASFWSWAERELHVPRILKAMQSPKVNPPVLVVPSRADIAALLKACEHSRQAGRHGRAGFKMRRPTAARDKAIIAVLVDTGLRAQELCSLTIGDVDLASGSVLVRNGKGQKPRMVYIGKATRKLLWRYLTTGRADAKPADPLFTARRRPLERDALSRLVRNLGKRAGVRVWPHLLRHYFATEFLRAGGNVLALRRLLGHASDRLLARYVELAECDLAAAHRAASPFDRL